MVNDCIRIALKMWAEGDAITSMRRLCLASYHTLTQYPIATCYRLTAISKAAGILKTYRKALRKNPAARRPYARKLMLTDCYGFRIQGKKLRLTLGPHEYNYVELNPHTLAAIQGHAARSITLTETMLSISYSKEIDEMQPSGVLGVDRNLDNATAAYSDDGSTRRFDLSEVTQIKQTYRFVKSRFARNDARVRAAIYAKYGKLQRDRVGWILHNTSSSIVKDAGERRLAIVMEDLRGIRKLYRRGNGQGNNYRSRLNSWSYYELQRQIGYKARWKGTPVLYVTAGGTSAKCSMCGSKTFPNEDHTLFCPRCKKTVDRDVNAARNILAKGVLRFGTNGPRDEAMEAEREHEQETLIRTVDGGKSVIKNDKRVRTLNSSRLAFGHSSSEEYFTIEKTS